MTLVLESPPSAVRSSGLRMRGDLEFRVAGPGGERYWAVKDPVALKYFHLRDEEYAVLTMLDGRTSLDEIRQRLEQAVRAALDQPAAVHGFLAALHQHGLVLAESAGQGEQLLVRRDDQSRVDGCKRCWVCWRFAFAASARVGCWTGSSPSSVGCFRRLRRGGGPFGAGGGRCWCWWSSTRSGAAARVSHDSVGRKLALADADDRADQNPARARSRAGLSAIRRRLSRDRRHAVGLYPLPVLQRVRLVDAREQMAADGHRRGRHVRRTDPGHELPRSCGGSACRACSTRCA